MNIWNVIMEIGCELEAAERKFPAFPIDPIHAAAILQEEAGELVQAALQFTYENGNFEAMRKEAVQTGAMALRFLLNMPSMVSRPSDQVERVTGINQQTNGAEPSEITPNTCQGTGHGSCKSNTECDPNNVCFSPA
jgi:hypothetical protein